ncbi:hypothetical protein [Gloeocapsa sp. PCC 73106]|uniref:hypothetical protein n=1 Tax=Gloeocapsa sp. PCC 73106 TaxID=102232 RepID=UPI0002AC584F|nr:hypothetical protein [Gloeocapsa sp. PCC 73106]ELR97814.1 hypothetical protein GLO73106DRAFT_00016310 [Gloeocapsa sp. PCC 73106]
MTINSKSTKAQILEAFEQLRKEKQAVESELKQLQKLPKTPPTQPINPPQTMNITPVTTSTTDLDQTLVNLEKLKLSFGGTVSNLSEKLITEATALAKLQTTLAQEQEQLKELYELESIAEDTLDNLIISYQDSIKSFQAELNRQTETLWQEIQDLQKAWIKEKETHQRQVNQRDDNYKKTKAREEEEYEYSLNLELSLSEEEYQQNQKNLYKELEEIRQQQEKTWREREKKIAETEKKYSEVKAKVEAYEQELEAKKKQGKDEGKGIGYYQAKVKADLRQKEIEGEKQNYQLRIQSLEENVINQQKRIESLSKQLELALKQVQDLAVKAIEGSSNRNSFEAMKEIAIEQAKNQQKAK